MKTIASFAIEIEDLNYLDDYGYTNKISRSKLIQKAIKNYIKELRAEKINLLLDMTADND